MPDGICDEDDIFHFGWNPLYDKNCDNEFNLRCELQ